MNDIMDLERCPFCGGRDSQILHDAKTIKDFVSCKRCKAKGPEMAGEEAAAQAWGKRTVFKDVKI